MQFGIITLLHMKIQHKMKVVFFFSVEINPILTYVKAKTMNSTTTLIQWTLKRFGSYIITRIKLHLRKLASKEWTHGVDEITRETGSHLFQDLKPDIMYVLHIEVINNDEMKETKTMVFTTACKHPLLYCISLRGYTPLIIQQIDIVAAAKCTRSKVKTTSIFSVKQWRLKFRFFIVQKYSEP